jgi:3-oxoadipate enol-lactonase
LPSDLALVAVQDGPADAPVLVLGNSLGTSRACWEPSLPALARHFRVLRYEHPGHGLDGARSPAPPGPYTVGGLADAVLDLLDQRGISRFGYAGVSLGGMVGLALAARAPGRVAGLALSCTSAWLPAGWAERAAAVRRDGTAPIADLVVSRWFTPAYQAAHPEVPAAFSAGLAGTAAEGYAGCCDAIAVMDLRPDLWRVTTPTLVIAGAQDPATPPSHGAAIAAGVRGARLRVIRGAAHLANVSAAAEVTALLLPHLRACAS